MWPNIEKVGIWDAEVSHVNKWENVITQAEERLSDTLASKEGWEKTEKKKDSLSSLMYGRVVGDARTQFLIELGKLGQDDFEIEVDVFEEKLREFRMNHPTVRHIYF